MISASQNMEKGTDLVRLRWPLPPQNNIPKLWTRSSRICLRFASIIGKIWLEYFNSAKTHNGLVLEKAVFHRPSAQPLITVSNHSSCVDDPGVWSIILPLKSILQDPVKMRWVPVAMEVCFSRPSHSLMFALGQGVPIIRGHGVYQRCMDFLVDKMNSGEWVHMYSEGKINVTGEFLRLKWGVGRLVCESNVTPIVLPIWHLGMDSILPNKRPYILKTGKKVTVTVGEPIDFTEQVQKMKAEDWSPRDMRRCITDRIQEEFYQLKEQAIENHKLHEKCYITGDT